MSTDYLPLSARALIAYGLFALPLSLLALPVYVQVPQLYAGGLAMPLTLVGTILLAARLLDAVRSEEHTSELQFTATSRMPSSA